MSTPRAPQLPLSFSPPLPLSLVLTAPYFAGEELQPELLPPPLVPPRKLLSCLSCHRRHRVGVGHHVRAPTSPDRHRDPSPTSTATAAAISSRRRPSLHNPPLNRCTLASTRTPHHLGNPRWARHGVERRSAAQPSAPTPPEVTWPPRPRHLVPPHPSPLACLAQVAGTCGLPLRHESSPRWTTVP